MYQKKLQKKSQNFIANLVKVGNKQEAEDVISKIKKKLS